MAEIQCDREDCRYNEEGECTKSHIDVGNWGCWCYLSVKKKTDRLAPVPQVKDCVERKAVLNIITQHVEESPEENPDTIGHIILVNRLANLPPAVPARRARADEEIERAIRNLEKRFDEMKNQKRPFFHSYNAYWNLSRNINLLRWAINRNQDMKNYPGSSWTDEELHGKEVEQDAKKDS